MRRVEFLKLIDNIYEGFEDIPWKQLTPQQAKFIGSLLKDRKKILGLFEIGKKGGISGENFPITVKILNKEDENPAVEKYVGFDNRWLVVYFGISPELENFVSIVMWPSESKSSRECYQTIVSLLKEERISLKFTGKYHIILPNEIHPQRAEKFAIEKDEQPFYSWQYFPFIKDIGDTLIKPILAPNYRKVLLRNNRGELFEEYITLRSTIGSVIDIKGDEIKVKVPFLYSKPLAFTFRLRHNTGREIKKHSLYYFMLIERAGERIPEVFDVDCAEIEDALAHCLAFELYRRFINKISENEYRQYVVLKHKERLGFKMGRKEPSNLFGICSINQGMELVRRYLYLLRKIYKKELVNSTINLWDFVFRTYLSPYFKIDEENDKIYYLPLLFRHHPKGFLCEKIVKLNKIIRSRIFPEEGVPIDNY